MTSALTLALDVQQTTGQDEAVAKSRAGEGRNRIYERGQIKVEGSNKGEQEGQGRAFRSGKDNKVGEISTGSEEWGDGFFSFRTHHRIAQGAMDSVSHLIQPVGDPKDRTNIDKGKLKTKSSIDERNTKDIHDTDAQEPNKSSRWRSPEQGTDSNSVQGRPRGMASAELWLDRG